MEETDFWAPAAELTRRGVYVGCTTACYAGMPQARLHTEHRLMSKDSVLRQAKLSAAWCWFMAQILSAGMAKSAEESLAEIAAQRKALQVRS